MPITYDPTTDAGKVRLLIGDTADATAMFSDAEISAFLTLESNNVWYAAATAFETIARNRARLLKRMELSSYKTEQFAIQDLLASATRLREAYQSGLSVGTLALDADCLEAYSPFWHPEEFPG